jgi:hypothetical protein
VAEQNREPCCTRCHASTTPFDFPSRNFPVRASWDRWIVGIVGIGNDFGLALRGVGRSWRRSRGVQHPSPIVHVWGEFVSTGGSTLGSSMSLPPVWGDWHLGMVPRSCQSRGDSDASANRFSRSARLRPVRVNGWVNAAAVGISPLNARRPTPRSRAALM